MSPDAGVDAASSRVRRTVKVVGAVLAATSLAAGCAAGQVAQTADEKSSIDGTNASVGRIDLRALAIEAPTAAERYYRAGSDVRLKLVLVNSGRSADALTDISSPAAGGWAAHATLATSDAETQVALPAGHRVAYGTPEADGSLELTGLTQPLYPSGTVSVTFTFAKAGAVTVPVTVQQSDAEPTAVVGGSAENEG